MYFVGIDVSKFKHDCAIVDELGDVTSGQPMRILSGICGKLGGAKKLTIPVKKA